MKINLFNIQDDFEDSNWWEFIRSSGDFAVYMKIPDRSALEVADDDILIHKKMDANEDTGARFVSKNFFQILDGEAFQIDIKDFRKLLGRCIVRHINTNQKYPYGWGLKKVQKKESIVILTFKMSDYESWNLKIYPGKLKQFSGLGAIKREDVLDYFDNTLPKTTNNPISAAPLPQGKNQTKKIDKITTAPEVQAAAAESGGKLFVTGATIEVIEERISTFQDSQTTYYILHLKGGSVAGTKGTKKMPAIQRDFEIINARCSEKAKETFALKVGDVIAFNGRLKNDRYLGMVVQNIRKFINESQETE